MSRKINWFIFFSVILFTGCDQVMITQPEIVSIRFEKNSEEATGSMEDQIVESGDLVPINENAFLREGWAFKGWATSTDGDPLFFGATNYILVTEEITLYAIWGRSYSLVYDGNGNSAGAVPVSDSGYATGMTVPVADNSGNLGKEGFSFTGWNRQPDGSGTNYSPGEAFLMGEADVTLYARWTVNRKISFFKNNGEATGSMADQIAAQGASVPLSANGYTYPGWTFAGWATSSDGIISYADQWYYTMGSSDISLYAIWSQSPSHQLLFDANGGSGIMAGQTFREGLPALLALNEFVREGYSFDGWAETPDGPALYEESGEFTIGTADSTLYARWAPKTYNLTYDKNDNDATGTMIDQSMECDGSYALAPNGFTKAGWTFAGWSSTPAGDVVYGDQDEFAMGADNAVLYAQWTANTYTLTFDKNDPAASGAMADQAIACGSSAALSLNGFAKNGWDFTGWAESSNGPAIYTEGEFYEMGPVSLTLYAVWTPASYSITFHGNDDEATGAMMIQEIPNGSNEALIPNQFDKRGWSFAGWSMTPEGEVLYSDEESFIMGAGDVDLYAHWTINSYRIIFHANDLDPERIVSGSMDELVMQYGTTVDLPENVYSAQYYEFSSWNTNQWGGGTSYTDMSSIIVGAGDITLYAQWDDLEVTLTFDKNHNEATGHMSSVQVSINPFMPQMILTMSDFTLTGYEFLSWNTRADGSGTPYFSGEMLNTPSEDITLYAIWEPIYYPIEFYKNDPVASGSMIIQELLFQDSGVLAANVFVRDEGTFSGWNTEPDGSGTAYADGASVTMDILGLALYAQWDINQYSISYYDTDGTGGEVPDVQMADALGSVILAENPGNLVKEEDGISFVLDSWALYDGGVETGIIFTPGESIQMQASPIELYAQWTAIGATGPAGGIIFIDKGSVSDGWRYMESAPTDQSAGISWNNGTNTITGAEGFDQGTGVNNSALIISSQGAGSYAAQLCDTLTIVNDSVSYDDWFLPSLMEMDSLISSPARDSLVAGYYWSSTSLSIDTAEAFNFDGFMSFPESVAKDQTLRVRAVRMF